MENELNVEKLQRLQNCVARIMTSIMKYDSITRVLISFHMLLGSEHNGFKFLLFMFKVIPGKAIN